MTKALNTREEQVLHFLLHEQSTEEIAQSMNTSLDEVNANLNNILQKWKVKSVAGIVIEAVRQWYVPSMSLHTAKIKELVVLDILSFPQNSADRMEEYTIFVHLRNKGYFDVHDKISELLIQSILVKYPVQLTLWQNWSNYKTGDGWYFQKRSDGYYIIWREPDMRLLEFPNAEAACAAFIKQELERVRIKYLEEFKAQELAPGEAQVINLLLMHYDLPQMVPVLGIDQQELVRRIDSILKKWKVDTYEAMIQEAKERGYRALG